MGIKNSKVDDETNKKQPCMNQEELSESGSSRALVSYSDSNTTTTLSQKSLISKLHLSKNRSTHSSLEKVDQIKSDSSATTHRNTKKRLFTRGTNKKLPSFIAACMTDEEAAFDTGYLSPAATESSSTSTVPDPDKSNQDDDPVTAAAARLSAKYDQENAASCRSCEPCMVSQHIDSRLTRCQSQNRDSSAYSHTNSLQTNENASGLRPLPKRDFCINKDWLDARSPMVSTQPKFMAMQEVMLDFFLRPCNDADRRKEKDRQLRLHYLLKRIWKGIYRVELNNPSVIVNWCCGIGVWDMEMALLFPKAQVFGIDFKEATLSNMQHDLPNLKFRHAVIHDSFTGLESMESNSVDFIMMRDVWLINTPVTKWHHLLEECMRVLKPGGRIECSEHVLRMESKGPSMVKLSALFEQFFIEREVDRDIAQKLGGFLAAAGFEDIDEQAVTVPIGEWGPTTFLKETGFLFKDITERRIRGFSTWVSEANGLTEKEFGQMVTTIFDVEVEQYHSYTVWTSYTAKKASSSSDPSPTTTEKQYPITSKFLNEPGAQSKTLSEKMPPSPPPLAEVSPALTPIESRNFPQ